MAEREPTITLTLPLASWRRVVAAIHATPVEAADKLEGAPYEKAPWLLAVEIERRLKARGL